MDCIFIYNPNSGKGRIEKKSEYIKETLEKKFRTVEVYATKSGEDTRNKAAEACDKYDAIVFAGGDGTFNDIINGISPKQKRPILGYIPSGTVNDIARNLKISSNIKKALNIIIKGKTMYHDVGRTDVGYFAYVAALGTFSSISYRTKQKSKKMFGKMAYVFDAFGDVIHPSINNIQIEIDNEVKTYRTPLILILNSRSVGGVLFNRQGHRNDGKFDIIIVRKGLHRGLFKILRLFLFGLFGIRAKRAITYYRASSCKINVEENKEWCIDGEAGPNGSLNIENLHHHFQIFVPNK